MCVCVQVLLGELCPLSGTICCGPPMSWYVWVLKGGLMGIKGKVKVLDYTATD